MDPVLLSKETLDSRPKRSLLNFCCCRNVHSTRSFNRRSDQQPYQEYEYVVEKMVIKRIPLKTRLECYKDENLKVVRDSETSVDVQPVVFSSYRQQSPESYVFGQNIEKYQRGVAPVHFSHGNMNSYFYDKSDFSILTKQKSTQSELPLKLDDIYKEKVKFKEAIQIHDDVRSDGKYLLKKIASDLSNHKDVKWKIIIKQNKGKPLKNKHHPKQDVRVPVHDDEVDSLQTDFDYYTTDYSQ